MFVDDDWSIYSNGYDADGAGGSLGNGSAIGYDEFASIQDAIGAVAAGGTIYVYAGTYAENLLIDKSVTLSSEQAGNDANARYAAFIGGAADPSVEAIITSSGADLGTAASDLVHIVASDVTIDGFVVDGTNPGILGSGAHNAIATVDSSNAGQAVDNLLIENNIVQNVSHDGIGLINPSSGSAVTSGSVVTGNVISNFTNYGVLLAYNAYADVTYNTITMPDLAEAGVWVYDFTANGGTAAEQTINVAHNTITAGQDDFGGIWANLDYAPNATLYITENTVNAAAGVTGTSGYTNGIYLSSLQNGFGAVLTDNTVGSTGGQFATGISLWNLPTTNTVSVSGGSVANSLVGIGLTNDDVNFGPTLASSTVAISGVSITGGDTGILVQQHAGGGAVNATISGVTIDDPNIGIDVDGGHADITGNQIYDNTTGVRFTAGGNGSVGGNDFDDTSDNQTDLRIDATAGAVTIDDGNQYAGDSYFIDNRSAQAFDLTGHATATYEGLTPGVLADDFRIEDKIFHGPDSTASGVVRWVAGELFVTTNGTGDNDETIQNAIDVADAGDTIYIEAGSYSESVNVNKKLTLDGAGSGSVPANDTIITGMVTVSASGASAGDRTTVKDLRVTGSVGDHGVLASGVDFLAFENVASVANDLDGFHLSNIDDLVMTDITASDNGASSPATVGMGIDLNGVRDAVLTNIIAEDNYSNGIGITARANTTGNTSNITINGATLNNPASGRPEGTNGINVYVDDADGASSISDVEIKGTVNIADHAFGGITLFNAGLTSSISGVQIGQNLGDDVNLTNNAVDVVIFGNVDDVNLTADLTAGANTTAGVTVLGLDDVGSLSPTNIAVDGSSFSGYGLATPAISLAAPDAVTPAPFGDLISINDVSAADTTFDGVSVNSATTAQFFDIEDLIVHAVDVAGAGLVNYDPAGNIYLTTNSFVTGFDTAARVQRAIDAADANDTIFIQDGTYTDDAQVVIDKDLTIIGEGKTTTTVTKDFNTATSGDGRGWWLVDAGVTLDLSQVGFDGTGTLTWQAIRHLGLGGTIDNVAFNEIRYQASGSPYNGTAVAFLPAGGGNLDVTNSMFTEIGRIGADLLWYRRHRHICRQHVHRQGHGRLARLRRGGRSRRGSRYYR